MFNRLILIALIVGFVTGGYAFAQLPDPDDPSRKPGMFQCKKDR